MAMLNNDRVQVTLRGTCFGQRILLVRMFQLLGDSPAANSVRTDLQEINTAVAAAGVHNLVDPYLACLPASYTLLGIRSQRITPIRSAYEELVIGGGGSPGTHAAAATVACDSAGIIVRAAEAGRHERGTVKIGPCPDGASAAGQLTAAYRALLAAVGSKLVTSFVPVGWGGTLVAPILYNRADNNSRLIQTFLVPEDSRVMRRRVVGRGE